MLKKSSITLCLSILAVVVASISALGSLLSVYQSNKALNYTKQINKAAISFVKADTKYTVVGDSMFVEFDLLYKNIGSEPLSINNRSAFIFDAKKDRIKLANETGSFLNIIHPNFQFHQGLTYKFPINRSFKTIDEVELFLKDKIKLFIITRIDFSSNKLHNYDFCYLQYTGAKNLGLMKLSDYKKIESKLPPNFKKNNSD